MGKIFLLFSFFIRSKYKNNRTRKSIIPIALSKYTERSIKYTAPEIQKYITTNINIAHNHCHIDFYRALIGCKDFFLRHWLFITGISARRIPKKCDWTLNKSGILRQHTGLRLYAMGHDTVLILSLVYTVCDSFA